MAEIDSAKFYGTDKVSTTIWGQEFWGSYVEGNPPATLTEDTVMSGLKISGSSFTVGEGAVIGIENGTLLSGHTAAGVVGGAIYCEKSNALILVSGSTFSENHIAGVDPRSSNGFNLNGGAAIYIAAPTNSANLKIDNTLFEGNIAEKDGDVNKYGGAIFATRTNLTINGSTFHGNQAYGGGAIYTRVANNSITNNLFSENNSGNGALALYNGSSNTVSGNRFFSNDSTNSGGAIFVTSASATLTGNTFYDNSAKNSGGAGIFVTNNSTVNANYNIFDSNKIEITTTGGAAISINTGKVSLTGNTYRNNTTLGNGGALLVKTGNTVNITDELFYKNAASKLGGAIYSDGATLNINGATFGTDSDTLYAAGGVVNFSGNLLVRASLTGDGTATFNVDGANFVFDNTTAIEVGNMTVTSATMQFTNTKQVGFAAQDLSNAAITVDGSNYLTQGTHTLATGIDTIGTYTLTGDLAGQTLAFADGSLTLTAEHTYNKAAIVTGDDKTYLAYNGQYYTGNKYDSLGAALANTKEKTIVVTGELNTRQVINTSVNVSIFNPNANGNICEDNSGAVLYITNSPTVNITGGTFGYNQSLAKGDGNVAGGAIYTTGTTTISKTLFDNNKTKNASSFYGGAINSRGGTLTINGATFSNNYAYTSGGAVMTSNVATISDSYFFGNESRSGGAVICYSDVKVFGGTFSGNHVINYGGALNAIQNNVDIIVKNGTLFAGNYTTGASGAGGAIYITKDTNKLNIDGATFSGNTAKNGGAIYIAAAGAKADIANAIFATDSDTIYSSGTVNFSGSITLNASLYGTGTFNIAENTNFTIGAGIDLNGVDFTQATITVDGADYLTDTLIATGVGGADTTKLNVINNKFMALTLDGTELWLKEIAGTAITENIFTGNGLTNMDGGEVETFFATKSDQSDIATKISGGKVESNLVGGAYVSAGNNATVNSVELLIGGTAEVAAKVYAGGYLYGNAGDAEVAAEAQLTVGEVNITIDGGAVSTNMYGGAHARQNGNAKVDTVNITVTAGKHDRIYAGGWAEKGAVSSVGTSNVIISGGTVDYLYGAGANADGKTYVTTTNITVSDAAVVNTIFMGGRYGYSYVN
ncbi:MAG: right-handed parallel beta-helix repeat-containing protein, partial [Lentisphaeria bacterium]|nr:right-handed parallel beta-helix repeat-containing protein [Lentisphaeria bacterium]